MKFSKLLTPFQIGGVVSKNRIVFSPIGCALSNEEGFVSDKDVRHYEERAKGGAGIIIIGVSPVIPESSSLPRSTGVWDDKFTPGLTKLSGSIKKHGAKAFVQLQHSGPKSHLKHMSVSASTIPIGEFEPRMLNIDEVYQVIEKFIEAGVRSKDAGFDGVELQSAHFYLLSSFLSPFTNTRDDEFGGDTIRRSRMVCEIVKGIKERAGEDFSVICRINGVEKLEGGMTLEESKRLSKHLVSAGADAIDVSAYALPLSPTYVGLRIPVASVGGKDDPAGSFVPYAYEIKKAVDVPVIAVSKLDDPVLANRVLKEDKADLIAIGRGLLADPYLPQKVERGRTEEINRCTYCNVCHSVTSQGNEIRCPINPDLGQ